MAICLNSVVGFNSSSSTRCRQVPGNVCSFSRPVQLRLVPEGRRSGFLLSVSGNGDVAGRETSLEDSSELTSSSAEDESFGPNKEVEASTTLKRAPLTARERLRAARVVSRYTTESTKPSSSSAKMGLGGSSKLPELLQDKGRRRPGLPEAPSDLLDDSDRGLLPKQGWSINIIPGGMDVFLIIFSFVFISTVMFATTYIVWKVGAIHFNEY